MEKMFDFVIVWEGQFGTYNKIIKARDKDHAIDTFKIQVEGVGLNKILSVGLIDWNNDGVTYPDPNRESFSFTVDGCHLDEKFTWDANIFAVQGNNVWKFDNDGHPDRRNVSFWVHPEMVSNFLKSGKWKIVND